MMNDKRIEALEKLVAKQNAIIASLSKRLALLERENKRRASEIASIPRK
jgi:uncharacterized coiled-coil protein SlyX